MIKRIGKTSFMVIKFIAYLIFVSMLLLASRIELSTFSALAITPIALFIYVIIKSRRNGYTFATFKEENRLDMSVVLWGIVGFILSIVINIIVSALFIDNNFTPTTNLALQQVTRPQMVLLVGVFAPIAEELLFRFSLKHEAIDEMGYSKVGYLILSGFLFGLMHIDLSLSFANNIGIIMITGLSGLGFGLVYLKSKSIYSSMLAHTLYNLLILSLI